MTHCQVDNPWQASGSGLAGIPCPRRIIADRSANASRGAGWILQPGNDRKIPGIAAPLLLLPGQFGNNLQSSAGNGWIELGYRPESRRLSVEHRRRPETRRDWIGSANQ